MKYSVITIERAAMQVCVVEHDDKATDDEIYEQALKVQNSSQFTEPPYVPPEWSGDEYILGYKRYDLDPNVGMPEFLTPHELSEALLDIEESKRVIEKPKRKLRKKVENE